MHILIFGDSIAYGAWDGKGGWVQRLRTYIENNSPKHEKDTLVYNCGVSGDTTSNVLERFEKETGARVGYEEDTVIIFSIGTNDCLRLNKTGKMNVDRKVFEKNIKNLIKSARKFSDKVFFVGLTPVDESKMGPVEWAPQFSARNIYIEKYDEMIRSVCRMEIVPFIEIFKNFKKTKYLKLLEDGDHPNSKGHEMIFEMVRDFLKKEKIIQ
ncbi:MAG: hypothetical protein J4400_00020 [Candidatus Aenigmarchaeota archaeon]|nr:hypothetical protein [Candidatus Aenigmarchaeota archaeon]